MAVARVPGSSIGKETFADKLKGKETVVVQNSKKEEAVREGGKNSEFTSLPEEQGWLQGAYTGKLKGDFLWKFHGEDLQKECSWKLKVTDMGDRMVLIQSETNRSATKEIAGFEEWTAYWFEWWRPWRSRDVNQRRLVWTRWIGVPLQAWSRNFFSWGCTRRGRLVEVHEITESQRKLDAAYIRILTGLNTLDEVWTCKIDGMSFHIRIEEIRCMEKELHLQQCWETESEYDLTSSKEGDNEDAESVEARLGMLPVKEVKTCRSATGGPDFSKNPKHAERLGNFDISESEKVAKSNDGKRGEVGVWGLEGEVGGDDRCGDSGPRPRDNPGLGVVGGKTGISTGGENVGLGLEEGMGLLFCRTGERREVDLGLGLSMREDEGKVGKAQHLSNYTDGSLHLARPTDSTRDTDPGSGEEGFPASGRDLEEEEGGRAKITEGMMATGRECWEFGKNLGLRVREGEDRVLSALNSIGGGEGGLGVDRIGFQ